MSYKCLTVANLNNKMNGLLPIKYGRGIHTLSPDQTANNCVLTATTNNLFILNNLQSDDFSTYYQRSSQTTNENQALYDMYPNKTSVRSGASTVYFSAGSGYSAKERPYIKYTGSPNSGYSTTYSSSMNSNIWSTSDQGVGFVMGYYENYGSNTKWWTVECQYHHLWTDISFEGLSGNSYASAYVYIAKFKLGNANPFYGISGTEIDINNTSESIGTIGTNVFEWTTTIKNKYKNAFYNSFNLGSTFKNITGLKRMNIETIHAGQYSSTFNLSTEIANKINFSKATSFVKYLYSPYDPGDVIDGDIHGTYYWSQALAFDNANDNDAYSVFTNFRGINNRLDDSAFSKIWVYAAFDIQKAKSETWFYNYLLMCNRDKTNTYLSSATSWSDLQSCAETRTSSIYYNGSVFRGTFKDFWYTHLRKTRSIGYVIIPVALVILSCVNKVTNTISTSNIHNIATSSTKYYYPYFYFDKYDSYYDSTTYYQTLNSLGVTRIVKSGSKNDYRFLGVNNITLYWNQDANCYADFCYAR